MILEKSSSSRFLPLRAWNTTTGAFDVPMLAARCLARRALASARTAGAAARAAPHAPRRLSTVNLTFVDFEGESFAVTGTEGETVLEAALAADIEIEAARVLPRPSARARARRATDPPRRRPKRPAPRRCGGELACSTCHVILEQGLFDSLDEPDEEEVDMLDLAWGLEDTSRLCCQLKVGPHLEGAVFTLPEDPY